MLAGEQSDRPRLIRFDGLALDTCSVQDQIRCRARPALSRKIYRTGLGVLRGRISQFMRLRGVGVACRHVYGDWDLLKDMDIAMEHHLSFPTAVDFCNMLGSMLRTSRADSPLDASRMLLDIPFHIIRSVAFPKPRTPCMAVACI